MGSLKTYLTEESRKRAQMQKHYDIAELFGQAYIRIKRIELAIGGFRVSWIYSVNRKIMPLIMKNLLMAHRAI